MYITDIYSFGVNCVNPCRWFQRFFQLTNHSLMSESLKEYVQPSKQLLNIGGFFSSVV